MKFKEDFLERIKSEGELVEIAPHQYLRYNGLSGGEDNFSVFFRFEERMYSIKLDRKFAVPTKVPTNPKELLEFAVTNGEVKEV